MINKKLLLIVLGGMMMGLTNAQSLRDGIKELYSGRVVVAGKILQKYENTPEGAYWLARNYLIEDRPDLAKQTFDKGLATNPTAPFLLVGKGYFLLKDKKVNEAKQAFEEALTNSKGKKQDDPAILNAVGRAMSQAYALFDKVGDINWAVQKLEEAAKIATSAKKKDNWMIADIYINLGDAYRRANPGEGSKAFDAYQSALNVDPLFAQADYRKALIFKSQRNWPLFEDNIRRAIASDPNFLFGYYELYYYKLGLKDFEGAQSIGKQIVEHSPENPNNEYFNAMSFYFNKNYDGAIASAQKLLNSGSQTINPMVYKLIAYCNIEKKDTAKAIPFVEDYFAKQKKDDFVPGDYTLKAMAYSTTPGKEHLVYQSYLDGLKADTVLENRIDMLQEGAKFFADKSKYEMQGELLAKLIEIKPADRVTINDYFNAGYFGFYRAGQYDKSWKIFDQMRTKFSDVNYGYLWAFNCSKIFDSANVKNIMVPDAEKLIAFSKKDTSKDAMSNTFSATWTLANYYNDVVKDKVKAIQYLEMCRDASPNDETKQSLQSSIDMLKKVAAGTTKNTAETMPKQTVKPKGGR